MSKRILSLVLALVMVLGTFGTAFAADTTSTGNAKVDKLIERGLVKGDANGYRLADNITRAEVATMVVRALDLEEVAKASASFPSQFVDMNSANVLWARGHVNVAAGQGIINGYPEDGTFKPAGNITNAEAAAMLVRVAGGLTVAEQANAVWPTTYLAKAAQLGLFEGVDGMVDYNAPATRENLFEMVYNAIINLQSGNYEVVKAIVLENYRVEALDKDEIVVEVLEQVQRANFTDESREVKGDQLDLTIPANVGDVEDLLGRVADFTLDKDGNVVTVKVDNSYKVEILNDADATARKFDKYTVEVSERYSARDERIFRTYFNNEAYAYEEFLDEEGTNNKLTVEYARVTTKNGKVLFIDGFNFDDIAPVKEVKSNGATVVLYNDLRNGTTKNISLTATTDILFVEEGVISVGSREEIEALDVVHQYDGGYIVRKDADVTGTYEKVSSNRSGEYFVNVEGEAYLINDVDSKRPVYAYDEDEFYTLEERTAAASLKEFEDEEVTVLVDLAGNLQYIGAELEISEFVALVTRVVGRDVRVLKADNKTYDFSANLDTKVNNANTGHKGLQEINAGELVYMSVDGDVIEVIDVITPAVDDYNVQLLNTRLIKLNNTEYRILSDTLVFVSDGTTYDVRTVKEVSDAFNRANKPLTEVWDAYVISGSQAGLLFDRPVSIERSTEAFAIVFTDINLPSKTTTEIVEFAGWANARKTIMDVRFEDGTTATRELLLDATVASTLTERDIVKLTVTDNDDKDVSKVEVVIEYNTVDVYAVADFTRGLLTLKDANGDPAGSYYVVSATAEFGGSLTARNAKVKISEHPTYANELEALFVVPTTWNVTANETQDSGVVTYIVDAYSAGFGRVTLEDVDGVKTNFLLADFDEIKDEDGELATVAETAAYLTGKTQADGIFVEIEDDVLTIKEDFVVTLGVTTPATAGTIAVSGTDAIVFSKALSADAKAAVETAVDAAITGDGTYTLVWSAGDTTLTITETSGTDSIDLAAATADIEDLAGNVVEDASIIE